MSAGRKKDEPGVHAGDPRVTEQRSYRYSIREMNTSLPSVTRLCLFMRFKWNSSYQKGRYSNSIFKPFSSHKSFFLMSVSRQVLQPKFKGRKKTHGLWQAWWQPTFAVGCCLAQGWICCFSVNGLPWSTEQRHSAFFVLEDTRQELHWVRGGLRPHFPHLSVYN